MMNFKRAIFRIESDNSRNTTTLEVKPEGASEWKTCFEYPQSIDYTVHTYLSSGGAIKKRRAVFVNSVKFYDNEEVIEGEAEAFNPNAYRDFAGSAHDLLTMGNVHGVILKDKAKGIAEYAKHGLPIVPPSSDATSIGSRLS